MGLRDEFLAVLPNVRDLFSEAPVASYAAVTLLTVLTSWVSVINVTSLPLWTMSLVSTYLIFIKFVKIPIKHRYRQAITFVAYPINSKHSISTPFSQDLQPQLQLSPPTRVLQQDLYGKGLHRAYP